jgi:tRNA A-37 threonylcarbamoyl transferase component Bud32
MDGSLSVESGPFAGRYTIEKNLGRGATATVYLARDSRTDRPVAIKVLRTDLAESLGSPRFLHEIKLTQALHHPRILPVLDSGEYDGQLYFVLPYMDGGTLRERLEHDPQLPLKEAVTIACTIAEALSYAHGQGFIHRDVKPENILFSTGEACLADFGIARAIERSIEDMTTSTGIARGTPAYMSPEQASGAHDYDGRSDIYSLACVLYEMIAGMRPFMGATTQAVISQRFQHSARELNVYRPNVPPRLESVIARAMQLLPADRYKTAAEFAEALRAVPAEDFETVPRRAKRLRQLVRTPARRIALGAGLVLVVATLAVAAPRVWSSRRAAVAADTTRIVMLPLEGRASGAAPWRDDDLMHQALSRWRGLHVVDQFQVADGMRRAGRIESSENAAALARSLGAGRYIRGQLNPQGDGWRAYVALFDVGNDRPLYTASGSIPNDLSEATATYARLADSLLLRGAPADSIPQNQIGSRSLPAVQAFARAQAALDEWDLTAADSAFQAATVFDPDYARASLWLAQVGAWREQPPSTWASLAERALALSPQLTDRERQLATALLLLGHGDYARSCDAYTQMRARNDRDFAAWFGLGQCRMMDNIVVADPTIPSGWRFRANVGRAMEAYAKAFEILPSVHRGYERGAFGRLRNLLFVSQFIVLGYGQSDRAEFFGRPGLIGDSLVLVAYPWEILFSGDRSSIPPGYQQALGRLRQDFRRIAANWSAAYPQKSSAKEAVAISLELLGDRTSIDTLRLARRLETDPSRRLLLASSEVVLMTKFGLPDDLPLLAAAQRLADSLLRDSGPHSLAEADALAPIAALAGHCAQVDGLVRQAVPVAGFPGIPAPLLAEANVLVTRMAMGCGLRTPNLGSVSALLERTVASTSREQHRRIEQMLLYRPVVLAPFLDRRETDHIADASNDGLLIAARATTHGDNDRARTALIAVESSATPGVPTPDLILARARLWIQLGDSARAIRTLDASLNSVRSYDADGLSEPAKLGALVQAMMLRAALAEKRSDHAVARRWANAARTLWSSADQELKSEVEQILP